MSQSSNFNSNLLQVFCRNLSILDPDGSGSTLLFSSTVVAREAAYMLRGDWDGTNAVTISAPDPVAIHNAVELLELELGEGQVEFCYNRQRCPLPELPETQIHLQVSDRPRSGKSIMLAELWLEAVERGIEPVVLDFPYAPADVGWLQQLAQQQHEEGAKRQRSGSSQGGQQLHRSKRSRNGRARR